MPERELFLIRARLFFVLIRLMQAPFRFSDEDDLFRLLKNEMVGLMPIHNLGQRSF